ncbi:CAAX prenyl protease-like protein [Lentzea atacamensis]|uniref:CAAX prenyl protease-like protein n=3 Tax=Lentzea TaxID=165301 RepID=A0A316IBB0_9PSEU|nr:CAAX prenyl protease-like protein [Lentzea atacamensis]RAS67973.1 CAAX prenyl protease-like protein [Lentzea atacamensis]
MTLIPAAIPTDEKRGYQLELLIVFSMTLGLSGLRSLVRLIDSLLQPTPLNQQSVAINVPQARADLLDLVAQLLGVLQLAAWGGIGLYLLWRTGIKLRVIGLDGTRKLADSLGALGLAAIIGIPGLAFYFAAWALGLNLAVQPSTLDNAWWMSLALILAAAGNAWAEEVLVVGYLITRLQQLGLRQWTALFAAAVLRGSYHLYQGFGGFVGNLVMGLVFGFYWQRTRRLWPLVIAHTILDVVAFVGYTMLRGKVSWLP